MLAAALLLLATASPQGKVILVERFEVAEAELGDAAKVREAAAQSLTDQGYQVVRSEERDEQAKKAAAGTGPKLKPAELILSAMVTKMGDALLVNAVLARVENRTLVAGVKVRCAGELAACGRETAEAVGAKLREETGVRVKLAAPHR